MENFVTEENDYSFLKTDGTPDVRSISKMWQVKGHEAARLPMIYAAAWNTSGERKYFDLYRKYIKEVVLQSYNIEEKTPTYSYLQMQCSFELLVALEKDIQLKNKMREIMIMTSNRAANRTLSTNTKASQLDFTMITTD